MPTRLLLDGPDIEALLARVQHEHGETARIVRAEKVRSGGIAGFFAKERFEVCVEVPGPESPAAEATAPVEPADAAEPAAFAALALAAEVRDHVETLPAVSTDGQAFADVLSSLRSTVGSVNTVATRPIAPPAVRRPVRPPREAGAVLALVGDTVVAYETAQQLARMMRINPATVLVASPEPLVKVPASRRIVDPAGARTKGGALAAKPSPSIVVVDLPIGADPQWTVEVVDGLGARAVWAVVDATRKVADLHRWTLGLPRIDALAVHNVAASADPGSVCALGFPVALLEGRPATDACWLSYGTEPPVGAYR